MTLELKISLAVWMIASNPDVTIGDYWKLIQEEAPVMIGSASEVKIEKRYYPPFRYKDQPEEPKKPLVRPVAKYDNRSREDILNQYTQ